jgi:hypothetical protein
MQAPGIDETERYRRLDLDQRVEERNCWGRDTAPPYPSRGRLKRFGRPCRLGFSQLAKAGTDFLRIEQTALKLDLRKFSANSFQRCELDPELAAKTENRVLALVEYHSTDVRVLSLRERFPKRQHATTDPRPRLENRNLVPGRLESVRNHQT